MILQCIAWTVVLVTGTILLATVTDSWYRQWDIDLSAFEKGFDMGLPKELHELVLVDGKRKHRHFVNIEPTQEARFRVVWAASCEHDSAALFCAGKLVAACLGDEMPVAERWLDT